MTRRVLDPIGVVGVLIIAFMLWGTLLILLLRAASTEERLTCLEHPERDLTVENSLLGLPDIYVCRRGDR